MNARRLVLALPLLAASVLAGWQAVAMLQRDLVFTGLYTETSFWGRDDYRPAPATVERTERDLRLLVAAAPDNPDYRTRMALVLAWKAYWSEEVAQRIDLMVAAREEQFLAMRSRPAHRQGWLKVLEYASRTPDGGAEMAFARNRLALLQVWDEG